MLLLALVIAPAFGAGVEAKTKPPKTGPGYTSPPLCCTEPQCQHGPGWKTSPAIRVKGPSAPVLLPRAGK